MLSSAKFEKEENYEEKGLSKVILSRPISSHELVILAKFHKDLPKTESFNNIKILCQVRFFLCISPWMRLVTRNQGEQYKIVLYLSKKRSLNKLLIKNNNPTFILKIYKI